MIYDILAIYQLIQTIFFVLNPLPEAPQAIIPVVGIAAILAIISTQRMSKVQSTLILVLDIILAIICHYPVIVLPRVTVDFRPYIGLFAVACGSISMYICGINTVWNQMILANQETEVVAVSEDWSDESSQSHHTEADDESSSGSVSSFYEPEPVMTPLSHHHLNASK